MCRFIVLWPRPAVAQVCCPFVPVSLILFHAARRDHGTTQQSSPAETSPVCRSSDWNVCFCTDGSGTQTVPPALSCSPPPAVQAASDCLSATTHAAAFSAAQSALEVLMPCRHGTRISAARSRCRQVHQRTCGDSTPCSSMPSSRSLQALSPLS